MRRLGMVFLAAAWLVWLRPASAEEAASSHAAEPPAAEAPAADSESAGSHASDEQAAAEEPPAEGEALPRPEPDIREKELIATIKMLFSAQDAVAAGHNDAKSLQASLLGLIASKDYSAQRMTGSPHLAQYLAGYLLSGGDPRLVEALVASSKFDEGPANLLNGCIMYRRGKREEALKAFEAVDLASLSPALLGRLALARAVITPDHVLRERLLSIAIASMPGTLVEEGALRRSALGFSESNDSAGFWKRVDRYTRRFPRSGYLPDFIQQVASASARLTEKNKHVEAERMDQSLSRLDLSTRQKVYVSLARSGSSRHMVELIDYAAGRLLRTAVPGSQEEQIALLYHNAYRLLDDETGSPRMALKALDPNLLPEQERKLLTAALAVSSEIDAPLGDEGVAAAPPPATPLTTRAAAILQTADQLLQEPM